MPRKKIEVTTPEEEMALVARELKANAETVNEAAAMIEPVWVRGVEMMAVNPFMEAAEYAEIGDYVLYAIKARDSFLKTAPKEAPVASWSLVVMPDHEDVEGGSANDLAQAKKFARMAYQAVQGVILDG